MLARGDVEVASLVSGVFPLAEAPQALRAAARPEAIKVLIRA
jgi:threonine dehydrogenase-like Zn-dependent dehydrogenase